MNKIAKNALYVIVVMVGVSTAFFGPKYDALMFGYFFAGFLLLIIIGHKAAFRQHTHGLLSQWTDRKVFFGMVINEKEFFIVILALLMIFSSSLAFVLKLTV